ncbi:hypothetical protein FGU71_05885 [Erythrobacter insulae]|uniref:Uncharacterized protein n=1 Tax=Erythrobacter insulae TaxID=2584124 RepID=A0A547PBB1_9SPHN|nr:hypothetical protein [Erythrobacter insulae]TRD11432.1 hypothetical protein FGU71_05885 [Erythrobacter insulae]
MFERINPIPRVESGGESMNSQECELLIGNVDAARVRGGNGGALRALEWNDLSARLKAARDLRLLMRQDSRLNIQAAASSFGDAAASYFQALEQGEYVINPDALERCKASSCIASEPHETQQQATRETIDD